MTDDDEAREAYLAEMHAWAKAFDAARLWLAFIETSREDEAVPPEFHDWLRANPLHPLACRVMAQGLPIKARGDQSPRPGREDHLIRRPGSA